MSARAHAFLETWVEENVRIVAAEDQPATGESLAAACIADGAKQGITEEELQDASAKASDGDLVSYMLGAIDAAAMVELDELTAKDD